MYKTVALLSLAGSSAFAGTTVGSNTLLQMEPSVTVFSSSKWTQLPANTLQTVKAMFVMKQNKEDIAKFEKNLLDISTPSSANYGKWLSKEDIVDAIAPATENVEQVVNYLKSYGVKDIRVSAFRDMIEVSMPVEIASKLLATEFATFQSTVDSEIKINRITKPYHLPAEIASVVSLVDDILRFPSVKEPIFVHDLHSSADDAFSSCGAKCNGYTTPDVLQQAYGFNTLTSSAKGNSVSVAEFQYQYWDQADINAFDSACDVELSVSETIGGNNEKICTNAGGCVEALLDIEYIGAISNPIPMTVIYSSDYSLLDWVNGVMEMAEPPLVHSVSYGNDEVQQTSAEYMEVCNTQFMMAGSMGLSILFASGDQGVWGRTGVGATFNPDFPAGSPYVTAVGGTNFQTKSVIGAESAWDCGGGGFSEEFARPSWQADAVSAYLSEAAAAGVLPASNLFNAGGRGYPDVSALGGQTNAYCISYKGGSFAGVAGTSASCPVVAGIFAQLNDQRLSQGKSSLGWLNPLIYSNPSCFNDVNDGSLNNCYKGQTGFAALNGWDPATGMGTPIYSCLAGVV